MEHLREDEFWEGLLLKDRGMMLMKKKIFIGFIALLVISMMGAIIYRNSKPVYKEVKGITASKGTIIQEVYASGRLEVSDKQEIYAPFVAKVKNVNVQLGDQVRAGQELLEMDSDDLNKQVESAKIVLSGSQSELDQAKLSRVNLLEDLKKSMDDYLTPNNPALGKDGKPTISIYQMQANYDKAKLAYERLLNNPDSSGQASLSTLENKVKQAQKSLNELLNQQSLAIVHAPRDGIIVNLNAVAGVVTSSVGSASAVSGGNGLVSGDSTSMSTSGSSLVTLADFDKLKVRAKVNEIDSIKVKVGQKVKVNGDAINKDYYGIISSIAPTAVTTYAAKGEETTVEILVDLDNSSGLKPGYNVNVSIKTFEKNDTLLLPPQAIQDRNGKSVVFIEENGLAKQHDVTVGISDEKQVEILSGLKEGTKVIMEASPNLNDGDKVKVNGQ
jgi:HlyD family secretion protein